MFIAPFSSKTISKFCLLVYSLHPCVFEFSTNTTCRSHQNPYRFMLIRSLRATHITTTHCNKKQNRHLIHSKIPLKYKPIKYSKNIHEYRKTHNLTNKIKYID